VDGGTSERSVGKSISSVATERPIHLTMDDHGFGWTWVGVIALFVGGFLGAVEVVDPGPGALLVSSWWIVGLMIFGGIMGTLWGKTLQEPQSPAYGLCDEDGLALVASRSRL
jgi:hypothetical protein